MQLLKQPEEVMAVVKADKEMDDKCLPHSKAEEVGHTSSNVIMSVTFHMF